MDGYYYLHTNGELIFKKFRPEDDSPFVKKIWSIDITRRETAWLLLIEALAMGARKDRIKELADKWGCDDKDAQTFVEYALVNGKPAFKLFKDGL